MLRAFRAILCETRFSFHRERGVVMFRTSEDGKRGSTVRKRLSTALTAVVLFTAFLTVPAHGFLGQSFFGFGNDSSGGGGGGGGGSSTISGPTLDNNVGGWCNAGLVLRPSSNGTLVSFVVENQSNADTIRLRDASNNIIQTLSLPGGSSSYTATVNWMLTANTTYNLTLDGCSNGRWASYTSWPTTSGFLSVLASWEGGVSGSAYWFTFRQLTFQP
jgi:hypothetical protein